MTNSEFQTSLISDINDDHNLSIKSNFSNNMHTTHGIHYQMNTPESNIPMDQYYNTESNSFNISECMHSNEQFDSQRADKAVIDYDTSDIVSSLMNTESAKDNRKIELKEEARHMRMNEKFAKQLKMLKRVERKQIKLCEKNVEERARIQLAKHNLEKEILIEKNKDQLIQSLDCEMPQSEISKSNSITSTNSVSSGRSESEVIYNLAYHKMVVVLL